MGDGMALRSKSTSVLAAETSSSYFPNYSASPLASLPSWFAYHPASSPVASTMPSKKSMLQNGLVSSWLEAMRAASPPRREKKCDHHNNRKKLGLDDGYMDWVAKHPSALNLFKEIMGAAKERQVALFLDYDGTLSPIVEDPECAFMSSEMRAVVKKVATHFPTSIISGRSRDKVYEFVQLTGLYYAGSHGMDIMGPAVGCNGYKIEGVRSYDEEGNEVVLFQPASEFLPMMNEVYKALEERAQYIEGAKIEHNKFCVSIHFRRVKEEKWHILAEEVEDVLKKYPRLFLTQGRKVLELRPSIEWDKGKAVDYLLTALGLGNSDVLPVYIGDDRTDEDAFAVLNEKLNGYSILVSNVAKATGAKFSLRDPSEVMDFLNCLVKWKQDHHIIS